jgi:hypothetical protein
MKRTKNYLAIFQNEEDTIFDLETNMLLVTIESCATGLAYLWSETPILVCTSSFKFWLQ